MTSKGVIDLGAGINDGIWLRLHDANLNDWAFQSPANPEPRKLTRSPIALAYLLEAALQRINDALRLNEKQREHNAQLREEKQRLVDEARKWQRKYEDVEQGRATSTPILERDDEIIRLKAAIVQLAIERVPL
jgi:hypothetical protein